MAIGPLRALCHQPFAEDPHRFAPQNPFGADQMVPAFSKADIRDLNQPACRNFARDDLGGNKQNPLPGNRRFDRQKPMTYAR